MSERPEHPEVRTDGGSGQDNVSQRATSRFNERYEECDVCHGEIDTHSPGYYKSANDETFRHEYCHGHGEPPEGYVWESPGEELRTCMNKQFNCGHTIFGPPIDNPPVCPECNPLEYVDGSWEVTPDAE